MLIYTTIVLLPATAQALKENPVLDAKVKKFIQDNGMT
jgi:hypothetical protein